MVLVLNETHVLWVGGMSSPPAAVVASVRMLSFGSPHIEIKAFYFMRRRRVGLGRFCDFNSV